MRQFLGLTDYAFADNCRKGYFNEEARMKDTIESIAKMLTEGRYRDEQHVRFSLVGRICQGLGWDIWNPEEFYTEYPVRKFPVKDLSATETGRVDVALFLSMNPGYTPEVYIEVKAPNMLKKDFSIHQDQLDRYNHFDRPAISILTDGDIWRFYLPQEGGTVEQRMFVEIQLTKDGLDVVLDVLDKVLRKENFRKNAVSAAESMLSDLRIQSLISNVKAEAIKMAADLDADEFEIAGKLILRRHGGVVSIKDIKRLWGLEYSILSTGSGESDNEIEQFKKRVDQRVSDFRFTKVSRVWVVDSWISVKNWWEVKKAVYNRIINENPLIQLPTAMRFTRNESDYRKSLPLDKGYFTECNISASEIAKHCRESAALVWKNKDNLVLFDYVKTK